ncbi:MAG: ABC transporter ATP-binding protein [Proteobacteria bacterium]|nr:ABC transporter ATP-binding protein [Pseudomonadota bacterium]
MLQLLNLDKRFGGLPALSEVSFNIARGRITALIGPNGSGKSTLINCITGISPPDNGSIRFDGIEINGLAPHRVAELGISRTFQNLGVFPRMTVLDNVLCGLTIAGGRSFIEAMLRLPSLRNRERGLMLKAMEALDEFGIADKANWLAEVLPYGDKKRVEMARAIVSKPRIVLLDEPVAGLNPDETAQIATLVRRLRLSGHTILLIEHDMELVMEIADHVVVLDSGRCIAQGTPDEVRHNPLVLEAYLGKISSTA